MASKHVSLPLAFMEGDSTEWFRRFKICNAANDWDGAMPVKKMLTLLVGEVLFGWTSVRMIWRTTTKPRTPSLAWRPWVMSHYTIFMQDTCVLRSHYSFLLTPSSVSKRCQTLKKVLRSSPFVTSSWQVWLPQIANSCAQLGNRRPSEDSWSGKTFAHLWPRGTDHHGGLSFTQFKWGN